MGYSNQEYYDYLRSFQSLTLLSRKATREADEQKNYYVNNVNSNSRSGTHADPKKYNALWRQGSTYASEWIYERSDLDFNEFATDWEKQWSPLCKSRSAYVEDLRVVVEETAFIKRLDKALVAVAGYRGTFLGDKLCYQGGLVTCDPQNGIIGPGAMLYVFNHLGSMSAVPKGWSSWGWPQTNYDILIAPDGHVLQIFGAIDHDNIEPSEIQAYDLYLITKALYHLVDKGAKYIPALQSRRVPPRKLYAGPTKELAAELAQEAAARGYVANTVREVGLEKALEARRLRFSGYTRRIGVPKSHLEHMMAASKETNTIAMMRANKPVAIDLIEKGAVGKPKVLSVPGFKSSPATGVLTASTKEQIELVRKNGYYMVEREGSGFVAKRTVVEGGKTITQTKNLGQAYWTVEEGQVITVDGHPIVGDYDGLGAAPMESLGRNMALVPKDPIKGDWMGPDFKRFMDAANKRFDKFRILHGAQEAYPDLANAGKFAGLTDELAYAIFPDGRMVLLDGIKEQEAFYEALGRKTINQSYNK
jgi:hypothetical protein